MPIREHYQQLLDRAGERYHVLPLANGASALITRIGGRVIGIFANEQADNLLWTNGAWADQNTFDRFRARGEWKLGGERVWIAPELQFNVTDRNDFFGTLRVPAAMDPGGYELRGSDHAVTLHQRITLQARILAIGATDLSITRTLTPIPDPIPDVLLSKKDMRYFGYEQTATIEKHDDQPIHSAIWDLVQLQAGGDLIIPCTPVIRIDDYFGSSPDEVRTIHDNRPGGTFLKIPITGTRMFKVGYHAACVTGRMAYRRVLPDGRVALMVRQFTNNPSAVYAEEPPANPGARGDSVHVYNDGGAPGFGEMECSGQAVGVGRPVSHDSSQLWCYVGDAVEIDRIARFLLGVTL